MESLSDNIVLVYVSGCDLYDIAQQLEGDFRGFINDRKWRSTKVWFVNQLYEKGPNDRPEDLPLWDLGLNFHIPDRSDSDQKWFDDVHATVDFLSRLAVKYHREFVLSVHNISRGFNEDVAFVSTSVPDLRAIRGMIEAHRT